MTEYNEQRASHWDNLARSFPPRGLRSYYHGRIIKLFREIIPEGERILEIGCAKGDLLAALAPSRGVGVDFSEQMIAGAREKHPQLEFIHADAHDLKGVTGPFDAVILSDLVNDLWDVQACLREIRRHCSPSTRIVLNVHNTLWTIPFRVAQSLGVAITMLPQNWLTMQDMHGLLKLSGFDPVSHRKELLLPLYIPFFSAFCNSLLAKLPFVHHLDVTNILVARPASPPPAVEPLPLVSVIVPARNEAGNIAELLKRIPQMGRGTEIIFVENNSSDGTFETIVTEIAKHPEQNCRVFRQPVAGKNGTVRLGFEQATGDILMILDADMTVVPEDLPKFYTALVEGHGELINGVRLVYPMHERAMRFLNFVGNKFFSVAFSWLLGQPINDTLCGTKVLWKRDYPKLTAQREYFGNFDPFGDFDLLFGAARINLKIIDFPVRYGERTYGTTNIKRWSHGWLLLRMVFIAARRLKFV